MSQSWMLVSQRKPSDGVDSQSRLLKIAGVKRSQPSVDSEWRDAPPARQQMLMEWKNGWQGFFIKKNEKTICSVYLGFFLHVLHFFKPSWLIKTVGIFSFDQCLIPFNVNPERPKLFLYVF